MVSNYNILMLLFLGASLDLRFVSVLTAKFDRFYPRMV